ncbi:hypothetical protein [Nitrobacter hamburgensis]|nr:hypothetical protein [Nitrobacter hamburgensis]
MVFISVTVAGAKWGSYGAGARNVTLAAARDNAEAVRAILTA